MVKNKVGGSRAKKFARKNVNAQQFTNRKLRVSENEDEMYAICSKMLGNSQIEITCLDGRKRLCFIRKKFTGKNKHNNMIRVGTWLICGLRSWESSSANKLEKTDLLEMYDDHEKERLIQTTNVDFSSLKKEESLLMSVNGTDPLAMMDDSIQFSHDDNEGSSIMFPKKNNISSAEDMDGDEDDDGSIDFDDI